MATFIYFTFQPLTLAEFQAHYPQFSAEDAQEILGFWLLDFYEKTPEFYNSQARQHRNILRKEFLIKRGIVDYEADIHEFDDERDNFIADTDPMKHEAMCAGKVQLAYYQQEQIEKKR